MWLPSWDSASPCSLIFPTGSAEPLASLLPMYKELSTNQVLYFLCIKNLLPVVMYPLQQSSLPLLQTAPLYVCYAREMAPNPKNGLTWPKASSLATLLTGDVGEAGIQHDKTCLQSCQRWVCFASLFAAPWQGQVEASGNEWLTQGCLVSQQCRLAGLRNADGWVCAFPVVALAKLSSVSTEWKYLP